MSAPPPSRLDANQCIQGAFDEDRGRLRTDADATIVNADIDVALDATEDSVESWVVDENGNPFTDTNYLPVGQSNPDNLNANANLQVSNIDVSNSNPVPVSDAGGSLTVDGTVELGAATLAALESITVQNGPGAAAVNIQDGGNSITVDGTVSAVQSGTWNINNITGTVSLPTGAATAANQATEIASLASIDGKLTNNYGASTGAIRTASQIGNTTGAANFGAGATGAQTLRTTSNITRNGTELSYNIGAPDANTLRTAAQIANATGAADFNSGATTAQTLRTASNMYNSNGSAFSNTNNLPIRMGQAAQLDATGRIRTTNLIANFEDVFQFPGQRLWTSLATAGGTSAHNPTTATIDLSVSTGATDRIQYRSRLYQKQNPGNAKILFIAATFVTAVANVRKRLGQFDVDNGAFFELDGTILNVVTRSSTSGAPVDTKVAQVSWNIDKLDGTGPSGITLDITKHQVFVIDYPTLGSSSIRFGFMFGNEIFYVHSVSFSNNLAVMGTQTLSLPVFFEVVNTAASAGGSMKVGLVSLQNEAGPPFETNLVTVSNGTTTKSIAAATKVPLLTIRSANIKIPIKIENFSVFLTTTDELYITLTLNGTLTGATFAGTMNNVQFDTAASSISGGSDVYSFYLKGGGGSVSEKTVDELLRVVNTSIGSDLTGATDMLSITATSLSGTASAAAIINLRELL